MDAAAQVAAGSGVMFSLPTSSAKAMMASATSSGCSTSSVGWLATPVIRISGGEFHVAPDFVFMLVTDVVLASILSRSS